MKHLFSFLLLLLVLSCHTKQDNETIPEIAPKSAEETLKNAVIQYPDSVILLENLLEYYTNTENYTAALAAVNKAIKKDSINPELRDLQSVVLAAKGDTLGAISSLEKAIELYPMPQYIISLGALYAETKNPLALTMADALLIGNKARAEKEAYFIKGLYYSFKNEKEKAIPFFDKCIHLNYTFMDAWLEKGIALYDLKKYSEAAEVLAKAVTLQNNFDRGYYYLGRCYEKLNRIPDAKEAYQRALMYDPDYGEAKEALSKLSQ